MEDDLEFEWTKNDTTKLFLLQHLIERFAMRSFAVNAHHPFDNKHFGSMPPTPWTLTRMVTDLNTYIRHHPPSMREWSKPTTSGELSAILREQNTRFVEAKDEYGQEAWLIKEEVIEELVHNLNNKTFHYDDMFWHNNAGQHIACNLIMQVMHNNDHPMTIGNITREVQEMIWVQRPALNRWLMPECIQFDQVYKAFNKINRAWLRVKRSSRGEEAWQLTQEAKHSITCTAHLR